MPAVSLLLVTLCLVLRLDFGHSFQRDAFCRAACARGKGGLICSCDVVHFAGKRSSRTSGLENGFANSEESKTDLTAEQYQPSSQREHMIGDIIRMQRLLVKLLKHRRANVQQERRHEPSEQQLSDLDLERK